MDKEKVRRLNSFIFLSLNGYYKGKDGDTTWHAHGGEESEYSIESLKADHILLFGRVTYEMMAAFWPTQAAMEMFPEVARGMNRAEKIVFSNTVKAPKWENTKLMDGNAIDRIRELKATQGKDMTLLGSGSLVRQCTDAGLIDGYQIMIDPIVLNEGESLFAGIKHRMSLQLINSRKFSSGAVLNSYKSLP